MATYKEIHGVKVQYRDSDATAVEGDVWYNRSTGLLKMYSGIGAWASGGTMVSTRNASGAAGTQTATIAMGGNPGAGVVALVENYDGSSWTEIADINTARQQNQGTGTSTAAITTGTFGPPATGANESWNGTSWTEVGDLNTARG